MVNDGSTTLEDRLGAAADLELVIRSRKLEDDIMVVRGIWLEFVWQVGGVQPAQTPPVLSDCRRHAVRRPEL